MTAMRFGLFSMNTGPCSYPGPLTRIARAAEEAGFDSLWVPEHYVLPDPPVPTFPVEPTERMLDPLETLSFLAGKTEKIMLGTGVLVLPHHNPVVLAKRVATIQALSEQRLLFGIAVGHLQEEFDTLGTELRRRGSATDEIIAAMRSLWFDDAPKIDGERVRFAGIQSYPRPDRVPIVVGGRSRAAYRRAVRVGDGFYGWLLAPDATAIALAGLRDAHSEVERPASVGTLEVSVTPPMTVDAGLVEQYAELGVERLIVAPPRGADERGILTMIEGVGNELIPRFA